MTEAIAAIAHMLRRVCSDPDFAWHMVGTESLSLCMSAWASHKGINLQEFREQIDASVAKMQKHKRTRIRVLEEQVEELRHELEMLDGLKSDVIRGADKVIREQASELNAVADLLNFCELRGEVPSIAALRTALDGKGLGACLQELEFAR